MQSSQATSLSQREVQTLNPEKIATTNQQLQSVKIHLQRLLQVSAEQSADNRIALIKAYSQALSFHFVLAIRAFMQEMAADYRIDISPEDSFSQLNSKLQRVEIVCQQCVVLAQLEEDPNSWLEWLAGEYNKFLALASPVTLKNNLGNENLIGLKDLPIIQVEQQYEYSYRQLLELVEQYRLLMQEW